MAIGNKRTVQREYGKLIEQLYKHYDELSALWPAPQWKKRIGGKYVNIGLEIHHGPHSWDWHGIRLFKDGAWRPMSFYGRVCLTPDEWKKVIAS